MKNNEIAKSSMEANWPLNKQKDSKKYFGMENNKTKSIITAN